MVAAAGYVARPETWAAAGTDVADASSSLAGVAGQLCHVFAENWGAWGKDDIGEAFCNGSDGKPGFGTAADNLLTALAQMVNLLADTGWSMQVCGANYAAAEAASTLGGRTAAGPWRVPRPATWKLPAVSGKLVPSDSPPAMWMGILELLSSMVIGCDYPDGNFGALGAMSAGLTTAAKAITVVAQTVQQASGAVSSGNSGQAADEFAAHARSVVSGLEWLASQCAALASSADNLLAQKQAARIQFWASLAFLAVMFAAAQALAIFTFGASEGGFLAAVVGQGAGLRALLIFVLRMVIEGMVFSAGDDVIEQFARMHEHLQDGFDEGEFFKSAGTGAVASLVTFGLVRGMYLGADSSRGLQTVAEWMENDATASLSAKSRGVFTRLAVNTVAGTGGNVVAQAAVDQKVDLKGAVGAALSMGIIGEGTEAGTRAAIRYRIARATASYNGGGDPAAGSPPPPPRHDSVQAALTRPMRDPGTEPPAPANPEQSPAGSSGTGTGTTAAGSVPGIADGTPAPVPQLASAHVAAPAPAAHDAGQHAEPPQAAPAGTSPQPAPSVPAAAPLAASPGADLAAAGGHGDAGAAATPAPASWPAPSIATTADGSGHPVTAGPQGDGMPGPHATGQADPVGQSGSAGGPGRAMLADMSPLRTVEGPAAAQPDIRPSSTTAAGYRAAAPAREPAAGFGEFPGTSASGPGAPDTAAASRWPADASGIGAAGSPQPGPDTGREGLTGQATDGTAAGSGRPGGRPAGSGRPGDSRPRDDDAPAGAAGRDRDPAGSAARADAARSGDGAVSQAGRHPAPGHDTRTHDAPTWTHDAPEGDRPRTPVPVPPERVPVREVVRIKIRNPAISGDGRTKDYQWGKALIDGEELPFLPEGGRPNPYQFYQGDVGDCGYLATAIEVLRYFQETDPHAIEEMFTYYPDEGRVIARVYETKITWYGARDWMVAEPTGRLFEFDMTDEVVIKPDSTDPGRPAFVDVRHAKALFIGMMEKTIAAADQTGTMFRPEERSRRGFSGSDTGFERINGSFAPDWAETMSMLTGRRARTFSKAERADPVAFMETVQAIRQAKLPVVTGTRSRYYAPGDSRTEVEPPGKLSPGHAYGIFSVVSKLHGGVDGGYLNMHNPQGGFDGIVGERKGFPEPIQINEKLWDVIGENRWATLDFGSDPLTVEQRALEAALRQADAGHLSPAPEVPASALDGLRAAETAAAGPGEWPAPDASRLARNLADILRSPEPDGAALLARLHEAGSDPVTAQRVRAAYADLTGRDLTADVRRADPDSHLARLLPADTTTVPVVPGDGVRSPGFAAALHDAISARDAWSASALLDQAGRTPRELWALDDGYREAYGAGVGEHIDAAFGDSADGGYLRYLAGDDRLAVPAASPAETWDMFRRLQQSTFTTGDGTDEPVPVSDRTRGAADRAHRNALAITEWGHRPGKIFAIRSGLDLHPDSPYDAHNLLTPADMGYNAAAVIKVMGDDGQAVDVVLDPAAAERPLTVDEWLGLMGVTRGDYLRFDTSGLGDRARADIDATVTGFFFDRAVGKLYSNRALVYTTDPGTYYPFAAAERLGLGQHFGEPELSNMVRDYGTPTSTGPLRQHDVDVTRLRQDHPYRISTLREADRQSASMQSQLEEPIYQERAHQLATRLWDIIRSGAKGQDALDQAVSVLEEDPQLAIVRRYLESGQPLPRWITRDFTSTNPLQVGKLIQLVDDIQDRFRGGL
jgi:hypothetical protein